MDVASLFFQYPGEATDTTPEDLTFLAHGTEADWLKVAEHAERRAFRAGEILVASGDASRDFAVVTRGRCEVLVPSGAAGVERPVAVIDAGSVMGEQAFLDGRPRSATIRALTDGELLSLHVEAFRVLAAREPELGRAILFDLGRILSLRLRQATTMLANLVR